MSKADRPDIPGAKERFNEEQATYAVRGSEQPDLEKGVAAIREVLKTLPARPGVYRMQDARGDVLALRRQINPRHSTISTLLTTLLLAPACHSPMCRANRGQHRLRLQHHARATAIRAVVHRAMHV